MKRIWRPALLSIAALLALPVLVNLATSDVANWWIYGIAAVLVAAPVVADQLSHQAEPITLNVAARRLAERVERQWQQEEAARRVNDTGRIKVPWRVVAGAPFEPLDAVAVLDDAWTPTAHLAPPPVLSQAGSILDLFGRVPKHRLVVLGGPGAGKSMVLIGLALQLLAKRTRLARQERHKPVVPVLFSLSTWNPRVQRFLPWLAERLIAEHPWLAATAQGGDRTLAQALIDEHWVLPMLDGFDEIDAKLRVEALDRITAELGDQRGLVLAGRTDEYRAAALASGEPPLVPHGAVGVELLDVTVDSTRHYLRGDGPTNRWHEVFAAMARDGSVVGQVLCNPLMISLAREVYNRSRVARTTPLPDPSRMLAYDSAAELRAHLLDAFVAAAYLDRPGELAGALRVLRYLAGYLQAGERDPGRRPTGPAAGGPQPGLSWWRLRRAVPRPVIGAVLGLPPAVAVGLVAGLNPQLGMGLGLGILAALAVGLAAGLRHGPGGWRLLGPGDSIARGIAGGFVGGLLGALPTGYLLWLAGVVDRPLIGVMGALGAGIAAGAACGAGRGVLGGVAGGAVVALTAGRGGGLTAGLVDGVAAWLAAAAVIETRGLREPSRGVRHMRWSPSGYAAGAAVGVGIGAVVWTTKGPAAALIVGLAVALAGGLATGLEGEPVDADRQEHVAGPAELLRRDRGTVGLVGLAGGLAFGVGAGFGVRPAVGLAAALTVGLVAASIQASWLPFAVARLWLFATGRLPLRLMTFLAGAHQAGVLRGMGGTYEFRHADLQRHLAQPETPAVIPRPRSTTPTVDDRTPP